MPFIPNYADATYPDQAEPDSVDFDMLLAGIRGDGVLAGCDVTAVAAFTPTDIAGLQVWLKADALSLANNDPVSTWTDSSGNGNSLTSSGADRPTYKTNIRSGLAVVRFFITPGNKMSVTFGAPLSQPSTIFFAGIARDNTNEVVFDGIAGTNRHLLIPENSDTILNAGSSIVGTATTVQTWYLFACVFNTTSSKLYRNGGAADASGDVGSQTLTGLKLGASYADTAFYGGDLGEVLLYNALLSNSDINTVGNYLGGRWGLTWTAVS